MKTSNNNNDNHNFHGNCKVEKRVNTFFPSDSGFLLEQFDRLVGLMMMRTFATVQIISQYIDLNVRVCVSECVLYFSVDLRKRVSCISIRVCR